MQNHKDILDELTDAAYREFALDPRWDKFSRNELSPDEVGELRRLAIEYGALSYFEARKPATEEECDELYLKLQSRLSPEAVANPPPPVQVAPAPGQNVSRIQHRRRAMVYTAVGLALAAGIVLALRKPSTSLPIAMASIPEFTLDKVHGDAKTRALPPSDTAVPQFGPNSHVELLFRPRTALAEEPAVRTILLRSETVQAWNPPVTFARNDRQMFSVGSIKGKAAEIFPGVAPGPWQICILVGHEKVLPTTPADIASQCRARPSTNEIRTLLQDIEIKAPGVVPTTNLATPRLTLETNGCHHVRKGPICTIPKNRMLKTWVRGIRGGNITLTLDGREVTTQQTPIQDGVFIPLELPEGVQSLEARETMDGTVVSFYRLQFEEETVVPELDEAEAYRSKNEYDHALAKLDLLKSDPRPFVRAQVTRMRARIERAKGNADNAIDLFHQAIAEAHEEGRISDELDDRLALVFAALSHGNRSIDRLLEAQEALEDIDSLAAQSPEGQATIPFFKAQRAHAVGDFMAALQYLEKANLGAQRVRRDDIYFSTSMMTADVLSALGRFRDAQQALHKAKAAMPKEASPCSRAALMTNLGWLMYVEHKSAPPADGGVSMQKALEASNEALAIYRHGCDQPQSRMNVLGNMALIALEDGNVETARAYLDEARQVPTKSAARVEYDLLIADANIALARKSHSEALKLFDRVAALAKQDDSIDHQIEAELGRARTLDIMGRTNEADDAYARADEFLGDTSLMIDIGQGRLSFIARYEQVARSRMDFLLRQTQKTRSSEERTIRIRSALDVARNNRKRVLSALRWLEKVNQLDPAKRAEWQQAITDYRQRKTELHKEFAKAKAGGEGPVLETIEALQPLEYERLEAKLSESLRLLVPTAEDKQEIPNTRFSDAFLGEDELLLLYHPISNGWVGFAATNHEVFAIPLESVNARMAPTELAQTLLVPFQKHINQAKRIRFSAYGALNQVPFPALPWNDRPLIHHASVTYGLDLPTAPRMATTTQEPPHAVIVADSTKDLPNATEEAREIALQLSCFQWRVTKLVGAEATREAVLEALDKPNTVLLHVAGHAASQGVDGWAGTIPLAEGTALSFGDIVTLPHVPPLVVLSACNGDNRGPAGEPSVLTLAEAFVVAGAKEIVAATDTVDDAQTQSMMTLFYKGLGPSKQPNAADLLRAAALEAAQQPGQTNWSMFRVVTP